MPIGYHHLTLEDRCTIEGLLRSGWSIRRIAKELKRSPGTISRELARNGKGRKGYRAAKAQEKAWGRRQKASEIPRKLTGKLRTVIREKLLPKRSIGADCRPIGPAATSAEAGLAARL